MIMLKRTDILTVSEQKVKAEMFDAIEKVALDKATTPEMMHRFVLSMVIAKECMEGANEIGK